MMISANRPVAANELAVLIHDYPGLKSPAVVMVLSVKGYAATCVDGPGREYIIPTVWLVNLSGAPEVDEQSLFV